MPQYESTIDGLQRWHTHNFENLGWTLLASKKADEPHQLKVRCFYNSCKALVEALEEKMATCPEANREDLGILLRSAKTLCAFTKYTFAPRKFQMHRKRTDYA